jgi:hypothetical protein
VAFSKASARPPWITRIKANQSSVTPLSFIQKTVGVVQPPQLTQRFNFPHTCARMHFRSINQLREIH